MKPASTIVWWEDVEVGTPYHLDAFTFDAKEIDAFEQIYLGARSHPGTPVFTSETGASAAQLTARLMRAIIDGYLGKARGLGAGGITHVDWSAAPEPGVPLTAVATCESKRALKSRPGVGLNTLINEVRDPSGALIVGWRSMQFIAMRDFSEAQQSQPDAPPPDPVSGETAAAIVLPAGAIPLGAHSFDRDAIIAYASRFDPQRFHLDDEAAARSLFGRLCASGWHTTAVWQRLYADHLRRRADLAVAPVQARTHIKGLRNLRWRRPVYVDDTITFALLADASADAEGLPGTTPQTFVGLNQAGEQVYEITALVA